MAENFGDFYYHRHYYYDDHRRNPTAPYSGGVSRSSAFSPDHSSIYDQNLQMFDPPYLSFIDYLQGSADHGSAAFGVSPPQPSGAATFSVLKEDEIKPAAEGSTGGGETPATPNSSISSSSTEGAPNNGKKESQAKETGNDGEDASKKEAKSKKKGSEKKEKQPRFAFMTKSEVDHLEDGYRWRKYGQKAVKNSPYPRSYYRCTTQKCPVKKRVERSFQDPSIVITTYEGQHNHHVPANLRGNVAGMLAASSMLAPPAMMMLPQYEGSFQQAELRLHQTTPLPPHHHVYGYNECDTSNLNLYQQQQMIMNDQQLSDHHYGLLQDLIPPALPKQEP